MADDVQKTEQNVRDLQTASILTSLRRHPRMEYQGLINREEHLKALHQTLPLLLPFRGSAYAGLLPILDWDHHLPSRFVLLRLYAYYQPASLAAGHSAFDARMQQIRAQDRFPEFDVPDFGDLPADEAYELVLEADGRVSQTTLTSDWRRQIEPEMAGLARKVVQKNEEFKRLSKIPGRPEFLGGLEARSWTPPCEGNHPRWSIDVWYLTEYNGMMGKGYSFLVDPEKKQVVAIREFLIRAGG